MPPGWRLAFPADWLQWRHICEDLEIWYPAEALEALDRIRGELTALFPRHRDLVNSFFLPPAVRHGPEEEPAPEPPAKAEGDKQQ